MPGSSPPLAFQDPSGDLGRRNVKLNNYYETFRRDMISILGNVKMPNGEAAAAQAASNSSEGSSAVAAAAAASSAAATSSNMSKENFDSYFNKLQTICTDNMSDDVKPMCDSMKWAALQSGGMGHHMGHHMGMGGAAAAAAAAGAAGGGGAAGFASGGMGGAASGAGGSVPMSTSL